MSTNPCPHDPTPLKNAPKDGLARGVCQTVHGLKGRAPLPYIPMAEVKGEVAVLIYRLLIFDACGCLFGHST